MLMMRDRIANTVHCRVCVIDVYLGVTNLRVCFCMCAGPCMQHSGG